MTARFVYPCLMFLALLASLAAPAGADEQASLAYRTRKGDTMASIAVKYYSTPDAAQALYDHNTAVFDAAYEANKKTNKDFDPKKLPKGKNTIFEGTDILLPAILESPKGILYPRRFAAMSDEEAEQIAKNKKIVLQDVVKPLAEQRPKWIARRTAPPPPPQGSREEVSKAEPAAKREPVPPWFNNPQTGWQTCAKAVCEKYASLCYAECLFVAKRFTDAGVECVNLPAKLPYMLDKEGRDDCSSAYP